MTATTRLAYFHVADLQVPISCAGAAVYPGDVLVGDADGVLVVPRSLAALIARRLAREQGDSRRDIHGRIAGASNSGASTRPMRRPWTSTAHPRPRDEVMGPR